MTVTMKTLTRSNPDSVLTLEEVLDQDGNRAPNDLDLDFTTLDEVDEHGNPITNSNTETESIL